MESLGWRQRRGSSSAARRGARQRAGLTPVPASNTLSCQWETLHPKLLRSKNPIDSDHGIYRNTFRDASIDSSECRSWVNRYRSLRTENRTMSVVPRKRRKVRTYLDQRTAGHGSHLGQISDRPAMTLGSPLVRFAASPLPPPSGQGRKRMQGFSESRAAPYPA